MNLREVIDRLNSKEVTSKDMQETLEITVKNLYKIFKYFGYQFNNSTKLWEWQGTDENLKERDIHELEFDWKEETKKPRTKKNASEPKRTPTNSNEPTSAVTRTNKNVKELGGTQTNSEELPGTNTFSDDEILIIKQMIKDYQKNGKELQGTQKNAKERSRTLPELVSDYVVPGDKRRSSFNLSSSTISSLEELAKINRINKQELVELAILLLIKQYKQ